LTQGPSPRVKEAIPPSQLHLPTSHYAMRHSAIEMRKICIHHRP
jgi:hypothetical protein